MAPQDQPSRPGMPSAFTSFQVQQNAQFHLSHFKFEGFEASLRALYASTSEKLESIGIASHGCLVGPPLMKRQREDSAKLLAVMNNFKDTSKKLYGEQIATLKQRGDALNRAGEQIFEELTGIEKRMTNLKEAETKVAEVRERQALFDARKGELEKTQAEVRDLQARLQEESESVQRLQGEMKAERRLASQLEAKLEAEKEKTSQLYFRLGKEQHRSEDFEAQISQLQVRVRDEGNRAQSFQEQVHSERRQARGLRTAILEIQSDLNGEKEAVEQLRLDLQRSDYEVIELRSNAKILEQRISVAKRISGHFEKSAAAKRRDISELKLRLDQSEVALATSASEVGEKNARIHQLEESVSDAEATILTERSKCTSLKDEVSVLKSRLNQLDDALATSSTKMAEKDDYMIQLPGQDASLASEVQKKLIKKTENKCAAKNRKRLKSFFNKDRDGEYCMESFCIHQKRSDWGDSPEFSCKRCEKQRVACIKLAGNNTRVMLPLRAELREGREPSEEQYWVL
ncbi:Filamin A-interacting protein 1-like [Lasiodiplodia theobromae]|uniref:Filamin A-interacting protein 1-like n=1 Tax=Lasiodiplodia theobromae TaxID=45133 RepID=A0A5N5DML3_9PEZI|nr:Filamin A-interacting protein 1-like [Lasiodiplodia theobromae]